MYQSSTVSVTLTVLVTIQMLSIYKALFRCHMMSPHHPGGMEDEKGRNCTEINEDKGEDHGSGHSVQQNQDRS